MHKSVNLEYKPFVLEQKATMLEVTYRKVLERVQQGHQASPPFHSASKRRGNSLI